MKLLKRPPTRSWKRMIGAVALCFLTSHMLVFTVQKFVAGDSIAWSAAFCVAFLSIRVFELSRASDAELVELQLEQAKLDAALERARAETEREYRNGLN